MSRETAASISRRQFMRRAGCASGLAAAGVGIEGILAARKAPAYAPGTSLYLLIWKNISPPADGEILRQGAEWGKQNNVTVKIEQIPPQRHSGPGRRRPREPAGPGHPPLYPQLAEPVCRRLG